MALYSQRERTHIRHEYVLPNPVNAAEFSKALSAAYQDAPRTTGQGISDDTVWVTHSDEEIIIYWEEKK